MLKVVRGDILEQKVDAIVVPQVPQEGLLCELTTRIYNAAGYQNMMVGYNMAKASAKSEREKDIKALFRGEIPPSPWETPPLVVVTPGFDLNAKYAIHVCVNATNWWDGQPESERTEKDYFLNRCYNAVLDCAYDKLGVKSIAMPLLGTSLLGFPKEFSRMIAERVIRSWLKAHTPPLTPDFKVGDEAFTRRWRGLDSPMTIYIVLPFTNAKTKPTATPAPVYVKPAVIPTPHKTPEPDGDDDSRLYEDYDKFDKRFDKARKKLSGRKLDEYNKKICLEYFSRIPNAAELAKFLGFDKSCITRYKNYFAGLSNKSKPKPKRLIALAIGMRLNSYERYEFFRCATNMYPYDDRIFNHTEKIIRKGTKLFDHINKELCKIDPKFDLTNDKKEQKKTNSAEKIR